jgi:hypothetical protein
MIDKPVPQLEVADLMRLWNDSTNCDKAIFSEMRTNLQIVAGQHYLSEGSAFWNRIRDNKQLSEAQRIKLTKNHSQRVTTIYRNTIESVASDVAIEPNNTNELRDQKAAELHSAYWEYIKSCENFPGLRAKAIKHFVEIGEVWIKCFWSMDGGQHIGNLAMTTVDPETGETIPQIDPQTGEILVDESQPQYSGKSKFELIEGYNIKRDKDARTFQESPYICIDKLIPLNALRTKFKSQDEELIKKLEQSRPTDQMIIYDGNSRSYQAAVGMALVREFYWRPGPGLPKGYYHFFTDIGILQQGELPYGIWPLHGETFEEQTGNPRGYSIIRPIRPPQVEINRCASKIAEHQITLGDDKAWITTNTKLNQGATLPGVRVNTYSGQKPEITEGRSGEQYLPYLEAQINELYTLANLAEIVKEEQESPDLYTNLFKSFRFKRKFTVYGEKIERFFCEVVKTTLKIAKASCHEAELIPAIGKSEYINVAEFKNSDDLAYMIRVRPRNDD